MSQYPEHEKLKKISSQSQAVGEFIEWLQSEKGITFAKPHRHDDGCYGRHAFTVCDLRKDELAAERLPIQKTLAEFFGIDENKIEQEKRKMLDKIRKGDRNAK